MAPCYSLAVMLLHAPDVACCHAILHTLVLPFHQQMYAMQELVQSKVELMLRQLWLDCTTANTALACSLVARDGFAFSLLWNTALRGINAREACCSDFWLPASSDQPCRPAMPSIFPHFSLEPGSKVIMVPRRLKTSITANAAGITITHSATEGKLLDALCWLSILMQSSTAAGSPITEALVRPLNRQGTAYQEKFLEGPSLQSRLTSLLQRLGIFEQESLHSFRRGMAQQLAGQGSSHADIMQRMLIQDTRNSDQVLPAPWAPQQWGAAHG